MFESLSEAMVVKFKNSNNYDGFVTECMAALSIDPDIDEATFTASPGTLLDKFRTR
ncbi:MAG: hypothetical protein IPH36_09580 [Saprospiraceae bacterium]|nr:hypothetical protein [Saprospiraceae bacterium]